MRSKEDAHDYRYFPNPDLPPVLVSDTQLEAWRADMPELPAPRTRRFVAQYGLGEEEAAALVADKASADFFEAALQTCNQPRRVAGLMQGEFLRECAAAGIAPFASPMTPERLGELAAIIEKGVISPRMAHDIFPELFASGASPEQLAAERGLAQVSDAGELEGIVDAVIADNPAEAEGYRSGKTKLMAFFVGQIMKRTRGKANPALVNELLQKKLQ